MFVIFCLDKQEDVRKLMSMYLRDMQTNCITELTGFLNKPYKQMTHVLDSHSVYAAIRSNRK